MVIKQTVVIIQAYHFCQLCTKFNPTSCCQVNSICRGNYWGSSIWISTQKINHWSYILHSPNTWEEMGIQRSNATAFYRLQECLWFS